MSTESETDNDGQKWYVVNTYSGYEQQARKRAIKQAASKGFESGLERLSMRRSWSRPKRRADGQRQAL